MGSDPWETDIPARFKPGQKTRGKVTKLTNFGVFVELEPGLEGLLHISELSDDKIESPEEVVKVGDEVDVKVLRVDAKDRKIGLSMRNVDDGKVPDIIPDMPIEGEEAEAAMEEKAKAAGKEGRETKKDLRGGTGSAGPLFQLPGDNKE
jgi:small subunit ribosomal protein S1